MKTILLILLIFLSACLYGQARLVINNDGFIYMTRGTQATNINIVLANGNANALVSINGNLISEGEYNYVKWLISNNTGIYKIPYSIGGAPAVGNKFKMRLSITVAGSVGGYIRFSTYGGNWQNSAYLPQGVPAVSHFKTSAGVDNSANAVDRFWIIDALNYATKPTSTLNLLYRDAERTAASNTPPTQGVLGAQRWNSTLSVWGDYLPQGTPKGGGGTIDSVYNIPISPANFFRPWVLVNNTISLPIELLYFNGMCDNDNIILKWSTASEINTDFFDIAKSNNGKDFISIGNIKAAGNSSRILEYIFEDDQFDDYSYYRLIEHDNDGYQKTFNTIVVNCIDEKKSIEPQINIFSDRIIINTEEDFEVKIYDRVGRLVFEKYIYMNKFNEIFLPYKVSDGIYILRLYNKHKNISKKIIIK